MVVVSWLCCKIMRLFDPEPVSSSGFIVPTDQERASSFDHAHDVRLFLKNWKEQTFALTWPPFRRCMIKNCSSRWLCTWVLFFASMLLQSCFSNSDYCFHNLVVLVTKNVIISIEMTTICKLSRSGRSYILHRAFVCLLIRDCIKVKSHEQITSLQNTLSKFHCYFKTLSWDRSGEMWLCIWFVITCTQCLGL